MASEQGDPEPLPSGIEEWLADHTEETGESRETVLARAVASYRLLTEDAEADDAVAGLLSDLESRIEALEADTEAGEGEQPESERLDQLEADLETHVDDLRSRVVEVMKEARKRAPADHDHVELDERLTEIEAGQDGVEATLDAHEETVEAVRQSMRELETEISELESMADSRLGSVESELGSAMESVETVETKADRLAEAVLNLRRRLSRVESHTTHQTALAELLETAAREDIEKARCDNCNEYVKLPLLVEPACPHCRSVFDGLEPGSMFFKSAWLTVADRPALEAGTTTDEPFDASETPGDSSPISGDSRRNNR